MILVSRRYGFPGVPGRISCRNTERPKEPFLAISAVVGQGLAGPLARDQDPPPGIAEVFGIVGLALAGSWVRPGRAFLGWMPYRSQFAHRGEHG